MMKLFMAAYVVCSLANVICCAADKQRLRRLTKVLLMPLLACFYLASAAVRPLLAAALLFGWCGDIFMIFKSDRRWLCAGIGSFGVGHICYIAAMLCTLSPPPPAITTAILAGFCLSAVAFYIYIRPALPDNMRLPSLAYCLLLCAVGAVAALCAAGGETYGMLLLTGAALFIVSDSVLSVETFKAGDSPLLDFIVMLTYTGAQAFLIYGFCLAV